MDRAKKVKLTQVLQLLELRQSIRLILLMAASAFTEGIGLLLLMPMLAILGGTGGGGNIAHALTNVGFPISLAPLLVLFSSLVLLRAIINHFRTLASIKFQMRVVDGLRTRAWDALLHCDWRVFSTFRQSNNTSILLNNVEEIGESISQMVAFLSTALTLLGIGAAAFAISWPVALGAVVGGAMILFAYRGMRRRANSLGEEMTRAAMQAHANMIDGMRAMRVVKSLGLEAEVLQDGTASFQAMRQSQMAYFKDLGVGQIIIQGAGGVLMGFGVWFAIAKAGAGLSEILPLVALCARVLPLLGTLQEAWQNWEHGMASVSMAFAMLDRTEAVREPEPGQNPPPELKRELVLSNVGVHFNGGPRPALDGINLTLSARSTLALVGASGSGKSTLADLAGGLLSPDYGTIEVDGIPLSGGVQRAWRAKVAYVQQEPLLFHGSVRENLARANPSADEKRIRCALVDASAAFVDQLPQGIDTVIGDGGRRLSGGEQQRIALARTLLRDPSLLILDEATSALDSASETSIVEAIRALQGKLTILIIAHRGTLVALADRVVELADGRIVSETAIK